MTCAPPLRTPIYNIRRNSPSTKPLHNTLSFCAYRIKRGMWKTTPTTDDRRPVSGVPIWNSEQIESAKFLLPRTLSDPFLAPN